MAVVQISKIQIRRGLKNSSSGVPQLSSAELAWAVDAQELFIGNGSVAEGAPYVGNTKILTEHDNIIDLASSYEFASSEPFITNTVSRSLGEKIDEIEVSVADFGAIGDGSTDNVSAFETAFEQLFRNANTDYRKVLKVPNGTYLFLSDLEIPSNVVLKGETKNNAILNLGQNNINFITSEGLTVSNFNSSNRPKNIEISNLTIARTTGEIDISGVADSEFKNVVIQGEYQLIDSVSDISTEPGAITWNNTIFGTATTDVRFDRCSFLANSVSLKCNQTDSFNTNISVVNSEFNLGHTAIYINGVSGQGNDWEIVETSFEEISTNCFKSTNGIGTKIIHCDFKNCGNENNQASLPVHEMIYFEESKDNTVTNSTSDRQQSAAVSVSSSKLAVSEVINGENVSFIDRNSAVIDPTESPRTLAIFSTDNKFIKVSYTLRLGDFSRTGVLSLNVDNIKRSVNITDNYSYSSRSQAILGTNPSNDPTFNNSIETGGPRMTSFEFTATVADNDSDSINDTLILSYINPGETVAGTISFDVTYGV